MCRATWQGLLGTALKAEGEFVGTPTVQWMRQKSSGGTSGDEFVPIPYATGLEYMPNADDVGAREISPRSREMSPRCRRDLAERRRRRCA